MAEIGRHSMSGQMRELDAEVLPAIGTDIGGNSNPAAGVPCPRRVLVIEDEPAFRDFIRLMLGRDGYTDDELTSGLGATALHRH